MTSEGPFQPKAFYGSMILFYDSMTYSSLPSLCKVRYENIYDFFSAPLLPPL